MRSLASRASCGIGIAPADARPAIEQLVEEGTLVPVHGRGWQHQAYLHRDAKPGCMMPTCG
ncbi:hypothetical protein FV234_14615 [Methylobacterium sp. WL8]|nr:hypothetical protein FV234_14615 [Methylobacterium sp. WL8]